MNKEQAVRKWVDSFNAIPLPLIEKAYKDDIDAVSEITPLEYRCDECYNEFDLPENNRCPHCNSEYFYEKEFDSFFPMWGTVWTFGDSIDDWWLGENLDKMADCGFRIYESDEIGFFFGIDGAGYSFLEEHWTPLYDARQLKWHDED